MKAACEGLPNIWFFPNSNSAKAWERGKAICRTCPVWERCLEYGLEVSPDDGLYGGLTPDERRLVQIARVELTGLTTAQIAH